MNKEVQAIPRDQHGVPKSVVDQWMETALADSLRVEVIASMSKSSDDLLESLGASKYEIINDGFPDHLRFACFQDRLDHMANPTSSVGELEIIGTAKYLNKTIIVVDESFNQINVYNDVHERREDESIMIAFHKIGEFIGHYNAVIPPAGEDANNTETGEE